MRTSEELTKQQTQASPDESEQQTQASPGVSEQPEGKMQTQSGKSEQNAPKRTKQACEGRCTATKASEGQKCLQKHGGKSEQDVHKQTPRKTKNHQSKSTHQWWVDFCKKAGGKGISHYFVKWLTSGKRVFISWNA